MIASAALALILLIVLGSVVTYVRFETKSRFRNRLSRSDLRLQLRQQAAAGAAAGAVAAFFFYRPGQNQTLLLALLFVPLGIMIFLNPTRRRIEQLKQDIPLSDGTER